MALTVAKTAKVTVNPKASSRPVIRKYLSPALHAHSILDLCMII